MPDLAQREFGLAMVSEVSKVVTAYASTEKTHPDNIVAVIRKVHEEFKKIFDDASKISRD